jgi:hypothetical protein
MTSISVQTHDPPPKTMPVAKALSSQLPLTDKSSGKVKPGSSDMKTDTCGIRVKRRIAMRKDFGDYTRRGVNG